MSYIPDFEKGLKHVNFEDIQERVQKSVTAYHLRIKDEGKEATWGPLSNLCAYFSPKACYDWFAHKNYDSFLSYAYIAAKSNVMRIHLHPTSISGCSANAVDLLYPLPINDADLIHWHMQYTLPFFGAGQKKRLFEIPYDYQHLCLQVRLALQKNWPLLVERCEQALTIEPKKNKLYKIDYAFYKALGEQDVRGMTNSLEELLSPKVAPS